MADQPIDPALLQALALQQQAPQPLSQTSAALARPPVPQNQPPDPIAVALAAREVGNPNADSPPSFQPQAATPVLAGSPGSVEASGPPRPGLPNIVGLIQGLARPRVVAP